MKYCHGICDGLRRVLNACAHVYLSDEPKPISKSLTRRMYVRTSTPMLRLRDDQWERILEHFPEEHIPDTRPVLKVVL
jgi:hypothetical protein